MAYDRNELLLLSNIEQWRKEMDDWFEKAQKADPVYLYCIDTLVNTDSMDEAMDAMRERPDLWKNVRNLAFLALNESWERQMARREAAAGAPDAR